MSRFVQNGFAIADEPNKMGYLLARVAHPNKLATASLMERAEGQKAATAACQIETTTCHTGYIIPAQRRTGRENHFRSDFERRAVQTAE